MQCTDSIQCPEAIFSFFSISLQAWQSEKEAHHVFHYSRKKNRATAQNTKSLKYNGGFYFGVLCALFSLFLFSGWRFFFHSLFFRFVLIFRLPFFVSLDFLLALLVLCITWWQRMTMVYTL